MYWGVLRVALAGVVFVVELALLFVHEMDAVRRQEWKMFIVLKDMTDEKAYRVFLLLHIPLYAIILALLFSGAARVGFYVTDIFLIAHMLVHWGFRRHRANNLNGALSKVILYGAGLLAVFHLIMISVWAR